MFKKILIANRGEIAVRIIRACRELSIAAAVVYSNVDRASEHVLLADEAYPIGPAPSAESYLRIDKLLDTARRCGADALHPGYGFLAENPALPRACREARVVFIGPTAEAMELMGSKLEARRTAERAGVPMVPGTREPLESAAEGEKLAAEWGYPVLLKAVAGGGGKGMRRVDAREQMAGALRDAQSEAQNAFGDPAVYLEKYLERPRHIEIQVLGDQHGNLIHVGERECSLQRRHQKVVEESPSPVVTPELRARMGEAAVKLARAAGYTNVGTVEFLVVRSERSPLGFEYYFLEMNARLQVEHPVTEMVTGLDLVKEQIRVAAGEKLACRREDIRWRGHAIECRIYAEDPDNNFFPSPGKITRLERPAGPGVRVDGYVYEGWQVPLEYDPLLAKLVVWGGTREEAVARLRRALGEYIVGGIQTNIPFFRRLVERPEFLRGELDTEFIGRMLSETAVRAQPAAVEMAAALAVALEETRASRDGARPEEPASRWKQTARREALRVPERKRR
ncbi:MAG: acetyl-CoA carboxylase biotin carboxylase subunit [Candidatus Acidiferrales bacterium]